jgi:5S rRNA maturation endonuclease (ribonuclease M5)
MTTADLPSIQKIAELLGGEVRGDHVYVPGPGHSVSDRSLSVLIDASAPDGFVINSFADDDAIMCRDYVREKLGLPPFEAKKRQSSGNANGKWSQVAEYIYRDARGEPYLLVKKCFDANGRKQFPQFHWDGTQWLKGKPAGPKIPYRLPELLAAPTAVIYLCEGKKDADALANVCLVATTASEGAGAKWPPELTRFFKDRHVVILPDADRPGRAHAQKVAKALLGVAASVKIVDLYPDRYDGSDVSDWIVKDAAGVKLAKRVTEADEWEPSGPTTTAVVAASMDDGEHAAEKVESGDGGGRGPTHADILIGLAQSAEFFHSPDGTGFADLGVNGHRETWPIRSKGFRRWLARRFFEETQGAPSSEALHSALNVIEAKAHFDAPERVVHVRVGGLDDRLYLDLGDAAWRAVEIDAIGWRVVDDPPVRFRRAAGMKPLPAPAAGGSIAILRPFLNVKSDNDFVLVVAWALACLRDRGPYPVLALSGEQGSAKSTFSKILRSLLDPNTAPLRALPREDRDLFIAASNGHVLAFDNVSGLPAWISDTLCRLATGGGFAVRQLYTDGDEVLFDAERPVILNGIEEIVTRPDLADRSLFLTLEPISEENRRPERELWAEFESERPQILGALLDAVVEGLKRLPETRLERLPRMADFALWVTACETALRHKDGTSWPKGRRPAPPV